MQTVQHRLRGTLFLYRLWPVLVDELEVETSGFSETSNHISHYTVI